MPKPPVRDYNMKKELILPGMKPSKSIAQYNTANNRNDRQRRTQSTNLFEPKSQSQDREQYYKFYLDSAQRAIEMMRKQHKSTSFMPAPSQITPNDT